MDPIQAVLAGVLFPALLSGVVLAVGWRVWQRETTVSGSWTGAAAITVAFLAAFAVIEGTPVGVLPGGERTPSGLDWLFWIALGLGVLFTFEERWSRRSVHLLRGLAGVILIEGVLRNTFARSWEGVTGVAWLAGLLAILLVSWWGAEALAHRRRGISSPLSLWATAATLAAVAGLSGSAKLAQLAGAVAAALGAAVVIGWWRPRFSFAGGAVSMTLLLLFGLALNAHFYSYTTGTDALLLAAGPLMPMCMVLPGLKRLQGPKAVVATLLLTMLPLSIALIRALLAFEPDPYAG
jgi:hypothetical protein